MANPSRAPRSLWKQYQGYSNSQHLRVRPLQMALPTHQHVAARCLLLRTTLNRHLTASRTAGRGGEGRGRGGEGRGGEGRGRSKGREGEWRGGVERRGGGKQTSNSCSLCPGPTHFHCGQQSPPNTAQPTETGQVANTSSVRQHQSITPRDLVHCPTSPTTDTITITPSHCKPLPTGG